MQKLFEKNIKITVLKKFLRSSTIIFSHPVHVQVDYHTFSRLIFTSKPNTKKVSKLTIPEEKHGVIWSTIYINKL